MNIGIILAGGSGTRFGTNIPKQYQLINGKEVIAYSIEALANSELIDDYVIVASEDQITRLKEKYGVKVIIGGINRNESLKNALDYINQKFDCKKVIILEAARPMITTKIINTYLYKLDEYDSVITGQKIVDSLGNKFKHTTNREDYYLIQAPEAFNFRLLYDNFSPNSALTATNQQMPINSTLFVNFDFVRNYKITYFDDLAYCEGLILKNEEI